MFERFTDRSRRVVVLAQEEARRLNHSYIGTEHLLLGMLNEGEAVAAQALNALGVTLDKGRVAVEELVGRGTSTSTGHIPFAQATRAALERSLREALQLGHNYIGTEHIVLGLVREGDTTTAKTLAALDVGPADLRRKVLDIIAGYKPPPEPRQVSSWTNPASFKPKLEHTVHASSLEQAHRLACEAGAAFFGVPIEAIRAEPQSARADLVCVDGTVLTYEVDFITTPLALNGEQP